MRADKHTKPSGSAAKRVLKGIGKVLGTMVLVLFLTTLIFACLFALYVKNDLSAQVDSIDGFTLDQTSVIYYEDPKTGQDVVLRKLYGGANRTWVEYENIPKNLIHACIAIEDKRFEDHQGVDWFTTMKACVKMFLGQGEAGGSTITQQLVKNITGRDEVTVRRKLVEIFSALELEKKYTKKQIMELYLNVIALGENCEGVESASQVYFGKSVSELDLAECAALIGITNNPSIYDPYINPEKNKERQEIILGEMLDQKYITQDQYDKAMAEELVFHNASGEASGDEDYYSYFEDQVINDVVRDLGEKTGYETTIVRKMLMTGGYKIYSTLNPDVQAAVEEVYQNLDNIPDTASSQQLQSGIVVIDNKTGDVVAVAGGVGEKQGSLILNRATQSYLSPGSTIKPVSVYAPALELGLVTPATVMDDTPYSFTDASYWPKNSDSVYRGLMNINEAVKHSINTIPVKLVAQMTPEYCFEFAKEKMGLTSLVSSYVNAAGDTFSDIDLAPLAMGGLTKGVTVKAMAQAYATFANEGVWREARTYTKVVDADGKVVLDNTQQSHVAMKDMTAWYITYMLENTVESGSGTAAQIENMTVAGKTGTTTSDFDRWFAGYTPYYTGVVWCGYDDPEEVVLTDSTANPATVLWQKVMAKVHEGFANREFNKPTNVVECTVCQDSGLLMTDACREDPRGSRAITVELSLYDVPTQNCNVHKEVEICGASGHVVNEYCKQVEGNTTKTVGLLDVSRAFPVRGIVVQDQAYAVPNDSLPAGYYPALSPDVDAINVECYIHTRDDLPAPEAPEEDEEETSDSRSSSAARDILSGGNQTD